MKHLLLITLLVLSAICGNAQTPVWSTGVAPILYNRCTACHNSKGIAPFALITYDDAKAVAGSIKTDVTNKKMPPWTPDPTYSHMGHERILSTSEINTLINWVDGGTPQGNPALAPPVPVYNNKGSLAGTPDLIVKMPVYTSTAASGDVYQCFVLPDTISKDKFIESFEAVPGNPACVHHVLVYADTSGECAALQAASTTPPGYPSFGGVGSSKAVMLGGWVPGSAPMVYPSGFGVRLPKKCDIVIQVHYPAGSAGLKDSTEIHFFFSKAATVRDVYIQPLLYHSVPVISTPLFIPANTTKTFNEAFIPLPQDISLLSIAPHMHLIGQSITTYGIHPAGDTDKLIRINKWDFHWQGFYMLPTIKKIPANTVLHADAYYDNTPANPENPNSPPKDVSAGEATTDEMMLVFFAYADYKTGDENILIDSSKLAVPEMLNYYHGQQLLDVCPNPAANDMLVKCHFDEDDLGTISLLDMTGRVVRQFMTGKINSGYTAYSYSVSGLPNGTYILELKTTRNVLTQKIVVSH